MLLKKKSGFTLLEVIIVIIIIGVLASLALPRYFKMVEYSRGTEALNNMGALRQSLNRCYLKYSDYTQCDFVSNHLDVENPTSFPNGHFDYSLGFPASPATTFTITASRNTFEGGNAADTITLTDDGTRVGAGKFTGI